VCTCGGVIGEVELGTHASSTPGAVSLTLPLTLTLTLTLTCGGVLGKVELYAVHLGDQLAAAPGRYRRDIGEI
jgi:hypothetical protein